MAPPPPVNNKKPQVYFGDSGNQHHDPALNAQARAPVVILQPDGSVAIGDQNEEDIKKLAARAAPYKAPLKSATKAVNDKIPALARKFDALAPAPIPYLPGKQKKASRAVSKAFLKPVAAVACIGLSASVGVAAIALLFTPAGIPFLFLMAAAGAVAGPVAELYSDEAKARRAAEKAAERAEKAALPEDADEDEPEVPPQPPPQPQAPHQPALISSVSPKKHKEHTEPAGPMPDVPLYQVALPARDRSPGPLP